MNNQEKKYYVYTNDAGKALFIKKDIFDDLEVSDSQRFIGESINKVLGIDEALINDWIEQAKLSGQLNNIQAEIRFLGVTEAKSVMLDFSVVIDEQKNFQGVDISFRFIEPEELAGHADSSTRAQVEKLSTELYESEILARYFIERIIALRVMTLRMGGIRLGKGLDSVFNQYASKKSLEVRSNEGNLQMAEVRKLSPSQMKEIFTHLEKYIAGVTSSALVNTVLEELAVKTGPQNLEIVTRLLA